jgi:hypothetical protein
MATWKFGASAAVMLPVKTVVFGVVGSGSPADNLLYGAGQVVDEHEPKVE